MGRPKGSQNRPGSRPTGPKPGKSKISKYTAQEVVEFKYKILELLNTGTFETISDAAIHIGVEPTRVYSWSQNDPEFAGAVASLRQVVADRLEKKLRDNGNFIPQMFLLKAYRPEFRDNFRPDLTDNKLDDILKELREQGKKEPYVHKDIKHVETVKDSKDLPEF